MQIALATQANVGTFIGAARKHARETGPGLASAFLLHGLIVALIVLLHMQIGTSPQMTALRIVPVDVV